MDKKIIYKDPGEREVSAVIDLSNHFQVEQKAKTGRFIGRDIKKIEGTDSNQAVQKLNEIYRKKD